MEREDLLSFFFFFFAKWIGEKIAKNKICVRPTNETRISSRKSLKHESKRHRITQTHTEQQQQHKNTLFKFISV